jgi:phytol kinase
LINLEFFILNNFVVLFKAVGRKIIVKMLTKLEMKRQLAHILLGTLIVSLLYHEIINASIISIALVATIMISILSKKTQIPIISALLRIFDREQDIKEFPAKGAIFYLLGSLIVVYFFPKDIALASIMILALGDSVSRLVGPYGYLKHPFSSVKFLEGIFAGAVAGFIGAIFFVSWPSALTASTVSMMIEGVDLRIKNFKIDDNLLIPVVSAIVMQSIRYFA